MLCNSTWDSYVDLGSLITGEDTTDGYTYPVESAVHDLDGDDQTQRPAPREKLGLGLKEVSHYVASITHSPVLSGGAFGQPGDEATTQQTSTDQPYGEPPRRAR